LGDQRFGAHGMPGGTTVRSRSDSPAGISQLLLHSELMEQFQELAVTDSPMVSTIDIHHGAAAVGYRASVSVGP